MRIVEKTPHQTAKELQADLKVSGVVVSAFAIHYTLNQAGLHGRRPSRTSLLKERHDRARLTFVKTILDKAQSVWDNVLWIDETRVELFRNFRASVYL